MLGGSEGALGPFGVQAARQHDVDRIDIIVLRDPIEGVVGIARTAWDPVGIANAAQLIAIARYERGDMNALRPVEPRHHLVQREVAEPDYRDANAVRAARTRRRFGQGDTVRHGLAFHADAARLRESGSISHDRQRSGDAAPTDLKHTAAGEIVEIRGSSPAVRFACSRETHRPAKGGMRFSASNGADTIGRGFIWEPNVRFDPHGKYPRTLIGLSAQFWPPSST